MMAEWDVKDEKLVIQCIMCRNTIKRANTAARATLHNMIKPPLEDDIRESLKEKLA